MIMTEAIIAAVATGIVSSLFTVAGLRVHINYLREIITELKERLSKIETTAARAHQRIDRLEVTK